MKLLAASALLYPLVLGGASPTTPSLSPLHSGPALQLIATPVATPERATYTLRAQDEMRSWQQRLNTASGSTTTQFIEVDSAATRDLRRAWIHAEGAARKLETVDELGWRDAKLFYEQATNDLEGAWLRLHPENTLNTSDEG